MIIRRNLNLIQNPNFMSRECVLLIREDNLGKIWNLNPFAQEERTEEREGKRDQIKRGYRMF